MFRIIFTSNYASVPLIFSGSAFPNVQFTFGSAFPISIYFWNSVPDFNLLMVPASQISIYSSRISIYSNSRRGFSVPDFNLVPIPGVDSASRISI